ncbi:MAG TPA: hypothetical protein VFW94_06565 [Candidatus Acidoferrales bacterium]|nr:hypothetical protein [Candidatus Acidoferrales bacterium]
MGTSVPRNASVEAVSDTAPSSVMHEAPRWRNHAVTFALFLLLGVVFLLPGSLAPSSALLGYPGDNFQHAWFLWHFARAVAHGQNPFYTHLLFYPSRVTLAWSTSDPIAALMALPLSLTAGPVVAYNLSLVLQLALAAFFGRLLCLRITRNEPAAFIGGMVFGFSSLLLAQALGHLSLVTAFAIPLFVLALDSIWRAKHPSWKLGILLGLALLLAALAHYNYVVVCIVFAFFWLVIDVARDFREGGRRLIARVWKPLAAGAATFLAGFAPFLWMMLRHPAQIPLSRTTNHLDIFSADVLGFLIPSWNHILFGRFAQHALDARVFSAGYEGTVYAGIIVLALAVFGFCNGGLWKGGFWKGRASGEPWAVRAALLAAIFYLLSLGPELRFLGHPSHIPGPGRLFYMFPFARFVSAPARFDVGVMLCLSILASLGVKFLLERLPHPSRRHLTAAAIAVLVVCDSLTIPFPRSSISDPGVVYSSAAAVDPPGGRSLSCDLPQNLRHGTVLTFPFVDTPYCLKSMWMQTADGGHFALIDGYLSYTPPEVWKHFWDVRVLRSLMVMEGMVNAPIDVGADRKTAVATVRELNLSAIVVYDSPESAEAEKYVESVFGAKAQREGNCTIFGLAKANRPQ